MGDSGGKNRPYKKTVVGVAIVAAFGAGIGVSALLQGAVAATAVAASPQAPQVIDLTALSYDSIAATAIATMHAQTFYSTANGSIGIQAGNVRKHIHLHNDEIQYIIEGTGSMWVGKERKDFKPGTLLIMPAGTAHGDAIVTSNGPVKALTIKLPPPQANDMQFVD